MVSFSGFSSVTGFAVRYCWIRRLREELGPIVDPLRSQTSVSSHLDGERLPVAPFKSAVVLV